MFLTQLVNGSRVQKIFTDFSNSFLTDNELINHAPIIRLNSIFNQGTLRERLQISLVDEAVNQGQCRFDVTQFDEQETYVTGVKN